MQGVNVPSVQLATGDDAAVDGGGGWTEPGAGRAGPDRPNQPSPRSAALRASAARIAGGLVFAAVLWLFGLRFGAAFVVVAVVVISLVSVVSPSIGSKIDSTIALVATAIGRFLTTILLAIVYFLVVAPVSFFLRLFGRDLLESPGTDSGSTWVTKPLTPDQSIVRRQFTLEAGASMPGGRRRFLTAARFLLVTVGALVLLLAVDLAVGVTYQRVLGDSGSHISLSRASLPAMQADDWAAAYFEEFEELNSNWEPFLGMVRKDYEGEYINITDRVRAGYTAQGSGDDAVSVYFFGGSTAWGTGQRDLYTIPSYLARLAEEDGVPVVVTNYGQSAWVIWQELSLLQQLLSEGNVPDVAVFYNGFNEVGQQVQKLTTKPSYPRADQVKPLTFISSFIDFAGQYTDVSMIAQVIRIFRSDARPPEPTPELTDVRAQNAIDVHNKATVIIERLAGSYGFDVVFVWQPVAFTREGGDAARFVIPEQDGFGAAYRRSAELIGPPLIDLTDSLDDVDDAVFIDTGHTNELGAEAVARGIYPYLPLGR